MRDLRRCGCGDHMHNAGFVHEINQGNRILSTENGVRRGRGISC